MPEVQEVCEDVIASAEGSLACAVVDLATGTTVAAAYDPDTELNANRIGMVSVAVREMFRGRLIRQFHRAWSSGNSVPEHFVREVQMATANSYQFISVVPDRMDTLFVLITDRTVSLGLGWMSVHQALEQLENAGRACGRRCRRRVRAARIHTREAARGCGTDTAQAPAARSRCPSWSRRVADPSDRSASQAPPSSVRVSEPRVAPPPPMQPPPPAPKQPPPPAVASPSEPEPATPARPAAHSQRTYRGIAVDEAPASQGRPEGDVPKGPRGRMFVTRRRPDRPKQ